ncbi:PTS sugar transporter subunit IIB [Aerococcus agrisoli]|uniref:PTS sugar transporter subunit IIB n=1 Tax=Aerococcus agrisoli TaxID=2487350 RepID=A0A3N4GW06_9LACT|nr:PTS sugar transporter subunit IIB [Aerococcus agrisoli]RPA65078.1 PTS sugar transporter subunit IIB [Aerococcus agrisoli]
MDNIKIMLVCSAGMSTSMLVRAMKIAIDEANVAAEVLAKPSTEAMEYIESNPVDVVLLGPHVRFFEETYKSELSAKNIPIATIPPRDYGTMDGQKVLNQALNLVKE